MTELNYITPESLHVESTETELMKMQTLQVLHGVGRREDIAQMKNSLAQYNSTLNAEQRAYFHLNSTLAARIKAFCSGNSHEFQGINKLFGF